MSANSDTKNILQDGKSSCHQVWAYGIVARIFSETKFRDFAIPSEFSDYILAGSKNSLAIQ